MGSLQGVAHGWLMVAAFRLWGCLAEARGLPHELLYAQLGCAKNPHVYNMSSSRAIERCAQAGEQGLAQRYVVEGVRAQGVRRCEQSNSCEVMPHAKSQASN